MGKTVSSHKKALYAFSLFIFVTLLVHITLLILNRGSQLDLYFRQLDDFMADFLNPVRFSVRRNPYFDEKLDPMHHNQAALFYMFCWAVGRMAEVKDDVDVGWLGTMWENRLLLLLSFFYLMASVLVLIHSLLCLSLKFKASRMIIFPLMVSTVMLYAIERANHIIIAVACITYFIAFYDSPDRKKRLFACLCLALAAVFKIYPVLFGFLYFEKRQYREIVLSAVTAMVLFFLPFFFFRHGIHNFPRLLQNWSRFAATAPKGSFITIMKLMGVAAIFLSLFQKRLFDRLVCIVFPVLILSTNAGGYTTLYFFPLVVLLFNDTQDTAGNTKNTSGGQDLSISVFHRVFFSVYFALLLMPLQVAKLFLQNGSNSNLFLYGKTRAYVFIIVFCAVLATTVMEQWKSWRK